MQISNFTFQRQTHAFVQGWLRLVASCSFPISCKLWSSNMKLRKENIHWHTWKLTWVLPFQRDTGSCFAVVFQHGPTSQGDKLHEDTWLPSVRRMRGFLAAYNTKYWSRLQSKCIIFLAVASSHFHRLFKKTYLYSVNLSDWCDCFYLFLNTWHTTPRFKHGPWPPGAPCPQPCTCQTHLIWVSTLKKYEKVVSYHKSVGGFNRTMWCSISHPLVTWHSFSQWSLNVQNSARPVRNGYIVFLLAS